MIKEIFNTKSFLPTGEEIYLGDILKGFLSKEVMVIWNNTKQEYGIITLDTKSKWYEPLEEFLDYWKSTIIRLGNTMVYELNEKQEYDVKKV